MIGSEKRIKTVHDEVRDEETVEEEKVVEEKEMSTTTIPSYSEDLRKQFEYSKPFSEFPEITSKSVEVLQQRGVVDLFPIQAATFKHIFNGDDLIARDLTGSGKTLAFCLPLVEKYRSKGCFNSKSDGEMSNKSRVLRAIILAPTRELALQTTKELERIKHSPEEYKVITVYGGVPIET